MFVRLLLLSGISLLGIGWLVDPRLVTGLLILYSANVLVSFWLEVETGSEYRRLLSGSATRLGSYSLLGVMAVTFNWMLRGVPLLNETMFVFMAGVEFMVGLFKLARITPRLRPLYLWAVDKVDDVSPIKISSEQIKDAANES
jgi:hypothetical protein